MTESRTILVCPSLPPLRLDRPWAPPLRSRSGLTTLSRGVLVLAALSLPVLGLRLADNVRSPQPGMLQEMLQAAVIPVPPPGRMAAVLLVR
jgi:hypothetical protein